MSLKSFFFTLLLPSFLLAQGGFTKFSGKIIDKNTQKPISSAYLTIPSKGYGTSVNENGEFTFSFPKINLDSMVVVSSLGYKNFSKKAAEFDSTNVIALESTELLANVQGGDAKQLVKDAFENIKKNNPNYPIYQTGFYHETIEMAKLGFVKINEGVIRVERSHTEKEKGIEKMKLLKSRKMEWTGQTAKLGGWGFPNGAAIVTRSLETGIPEYLDKGNINDYSFKIDSLMTSFNDNVVYSISFLPINKRVKAGRNGKIYLDVHSQAIVRIEYEMTPEGVKDVIKSSITDNTKKDGKVMKGYTQFIPLYGLWHLADCQLVFEATFEDKLEKSFKNDAIMKLRFVVNESMKLGNRSAIKFDEELLTTDNFTKAIRLDDRVWQQYNYLIPTAEMMKFSEKKK